MSRPQGLKPDVQQRDFGTAEEAAEKFRTRAPVPSAEAGSERKESAWLAQRPALPEFLSNRFF